MATPVATAQPGLAGSVDAEPIYICQACLAEQTLPRTGTIVCKQCAHPTGTSRVFFKKRVQATEYKAM